MKKQKCKWNEKKRTIRNHIVFKAGYYDYAYALSPTSTARLSFSTDETRGNIWEAENEYNIFVYYRELGGRYDQLLNVTTLNSLQNRPGSFNFFIKGFFCDLRRQVLYDQLLLNSPRAGR